MPTEYMPISVVTIGEDATLDAYSGFLVVMVSPNAQNIRLTLPSAADAGGYIIIKTSDSHEVTLATDGTETINGETSFSKLTETGNGYVVWSDGTNWKMRNPTYFLGYPVS